MTEKEKADAYNKVLEKAKAIINDPNASSVWKNWICNCFPELAESEDERIIKWIIDDIRFNMNNEPLNNSKYKKEAEKAIAWLEKQGEKHPDPYNGISFEYNGHTWGMCARDNGVDISCDKHLIKHLENQTEQEKDILEDAILDGNEDGLIAETIRYKHEKQAEQKLDKVEPKFKVGDWITNGRYTRLIVGINSDWIYYMFKDGTSKWIKDIDKNYHLWTIRDAKDGDVLANDNEIVIFKENNFNQKDLSGCMFVYCSLRDKKGYWYTIGGINPSNYVPATKEQRDLLFQKMHKAGYEWDAETKELRKFEQKPADSYCQENCKGFQEIGKCFADGECKAKREAEQKSTWSEEDETNLTNTIIMLKEGASHHFLNSSIVPCVNWLISFKDRVQPKQEWSEEDSIRLQRIIDFLWYNRKGDTDTIYQQERDIDWLKSLRPQNKWKPSDEQMEALDWQVENTSVGSWQYKATKELFGDLKKLKEE